MRARTGRLYRGDELVALTPKALETLRFLIERRGQTVGRDEILEELWGEAFVEEAVLTQNIYTLRKTLADGDPEGSYIETIPKRGYRFLAEVSTEAPGPEPAQGRGRRLPLPARLVMAALLLTVVGFLLVQRLRTAEPEQPHIRSLAVLPFLPLASAEEDQALGLGMADALIVRLSGLPEISVRPTSTVRTFTGADRRVSEITNTLGVDALLDGSLQRSGDRVRVSVQLVAAPEGDPIWADTFETVRADLFSMQDEIAARVATALSLELGATGGSPDEVTPDAYQAYVTGRYFWNQRSAASLTRAIRSFEEAVALAPDYARAHAGLADCYVLLPLFGNLRPAEAFPKAISAAAEALALDPDLADAHTTLAYSRFLYEWDWDAAERGFRRALDLNPSYATAHQWYSYFLTARGRHDEAVAEVAEALTLDPVSLIINADAGLVFYFARRFEEAEARFQQTLELDPDFAYARFGLGMTLEALGRAQEGLEHARAAVELTNRSSAMLGFLGRALGASGLRTEALEILGELEERSLSDYVQAGHTAMIHTGLGDTNNAILWWRRAIEERSRFAPFFAVWTVFDRLAEDARFRELVASVDPES